MRLLLLRHGETTLGGDRYLGSRCDPGLSERGQEQARAAAAVLDHRPLRAVVVSPLRRALETARLIRPDVAPSVDERLRELDFGSLSGLTWAEVASRHPRFAAGWRSTLWPAPPGGERPSDFVARVLAAALDLAAAHRGPGDVLVVCHGGPIRTLVGTARGLAPLGGWHIGTAHGTVRTVRVGPVTLRRWHSARQAVAAAT